MELLFLEALLIIIKLNIFHCLVCINYAILTFFFFLNSKKFYFHCFPANFGGCLLKNILLQCHFPFIQ